MDGIFWIIPKREELRVYAVEGKTEAEADAAWGLLIAEHPELLLIDPARIPRGRVEFKGGRACVFLPPAQQKAEVFREVEHIFGLTQMYDVISI